MFLDERGCVIWYHCAFKFMLECQHSSNYTFKSTTNFNLVRKKWFTLCFDSVLWVIYFNAAKIYFHHNFQMNIFNPKIMKFPILVETLIFVLFLSCCTTVDCLNIVIVKWFSSHTWLKMIKNLVVMEYSRYIIRYSVLDILIREWAKFLFAFWFQFCFRATRLPSIMMYDAF